MLQPGTRAPDFTLPNQDGQPTSLASLIAEHGLILYFYPADFTPGCTREARFMRDLHPDIEQAGLRVAGASPQAPSTHRAFREQYHLPFTLLADTDRAIAKRYGAVWPFGLGIRRATFLIDHHGVVQSAICADLRIDKHEAFIRQAVLGYRAQ